MTNHVHLVSVVLLRLRQKIAFISLVSHLKMYTIGVAILRVNIKFKNASLRSDQKAVCLSIVRYDVYLDLLPLVQSAK